MDILSAIILGLIQGAAEFLPVSSSGHLSLAHSFFGLISPEEFPAFDVLLHFGTLIAVFIVFFKDIVRLVKGFFSLISKVFKGKFKLSEYSVNEKFALYVIIATLPLVLIALVGADEWVESLSAIPLAVGGILIFNGIMLLLSDRISKGNINESNSKPINALTVGLCQMLAVLPGLSRSGATITGGLFCGFTREYAVKFSFIMSIPAILGANVLSISDIIGAGISSSDIAVYAAGVISAAVFGLLAIKLLVYISKKSNFTPFAYYCFAVGLAAVIAGIII